MTFLTQGWPPRLRAQEQGGVQVQADVPKLSTCCKPDHHNNEDGDDNGAVLGCNGFVKI